MNYLIISILSVLVNIPLGWMRNFTKKFSILWFICIHASIPLIVYLRITLETSKIFIPICIALAVLGQFIGSKFLVKNKSFVIY